MPRAMTRISANLERTTMVRLLYRSARKPAKPENSTKGIEKTAIAMCCRSWTATFSDSNSISCLNRLSLKAPQNWVTVMPQKLESRYSRGMCAFVLR